MKVCAGCGARSSNKTYRFRFQTGRGTSLQVEGFLSSCGRGERVCVYLLSKRMIVLNWTGDVEMEMDMEHGPGNGTELNGAGWVCCALGVR